MEEYSNPEFFQSGSIYRMKFTNFMQYRETEVIMGPNLNVIVGPNGAGKSTIVNGICIGLAGKLNVLGRATKIADFILVGKDKAMIEIELFMKDKENIIINRQWTLNGKTEWKLNRKNSSEKEVKETVGKLRIQVDNLCQFLPQDKVHDFSRLDNKGLLSNTIDAVGDTGLKEKHALLKQLQNEFDDGDRLHQSKETAYEQKVAQCAKMEDDVQAFHQKKSLMEKIESLEKKRKWAEFNKSKTEFLEKRKSYDEKKKWYDQEKECLAPFDKEIAEIKKKHAKIAKIKADDQERDVDGKIRTHTNRMKEFQNSLLSLEDEESDRIRNIKEKEKNRSNYEKQINELTAENKENEIEGLADKLEQAKKLTQEANQLVAVEKEQVEQKGFEINGKQSELKRYQTELNKLRNIEDIKMGNLKNLNMQVFEAVQWLRNNKGKYNGEVYEPLMLCSNIPVEEHSIYIENSIPFRDMTIFFFQESDDMNSFLNTVRKDMRLETVGAAVLTARSMLAMKSRVPAAQLQRFGLISYLSDMMQAPEPVLAHLCNSFNLHNIAVFSPASEKFNEQIQSMGITKYFFGHKMQSVIKSGYSGRITTKTSEINSRGTLGRSVDKNRVDQLCGAEAACKQVIQDLKKEQESLSMNLKHLVQQLESRKNEQRQLANTQNFLQKNSRLIDRYHKMLSEIQWSKEDDTEKKKIMDKKTEKIELMMDTLQIIQNITQSSIKEKLQKSAKCIELSPLERRLSLKERERASKQEQMSEIKQDLDKQLAEVKRIENNMLAFLKEAKAATGVEKGSKSKPPPEYYDYWKQENFPSSVDMIDQMHGELEAQLSCTDHLDKDILEKYRSIKEQIQDLEKDIARRSKVKQNQERKIQQIKEEWLTGLNNLINQIHDRFSSFFLKMGFAGQVELYTGKNENDFDNYGIKILVKYRDHEVLQELNAHRQSGGERSVATAIFMLSLQALTTVPFRCVDEINQGMDAVNERKVFDLLVKTSCQESNAQYFLLTPKLLPGLQYNPRMNVLFVHNGPNMMHYSDWDLDGFISKFESQSM